MSQAKVTCAPLDDQAAGAQSMSMDTAARVSVLSTWLRSMLDPYVRAESASLTVTLSELPAFAAVAPARQDAVNLDAQTTGVRKVPYLALSAATWIMIGSDKPRSTACATMSICVFLSYNSYAAYAYRVRTVDYAGEPVAGVSSEGQARASGVCSSRRTRRVGSVAASHRWRLGRGDDLPWTGSN